MLNRHQLRSLIKKTIVGKLQRQGINKYKEYKVLNHIPDLISILTDLMSPKFDLFVKDIEWVSPKPPTFRIILENDQYFYLSDLVRSWVAEVQGKKFYLLNLGEEEMAISAISRILRYGKPINPDMGFAETANSAGGEGGMEAQLDQAPGRAAAETSTEEKPEGIPDELLY